MNSITAVLLGLIQGITEFLPVSSSGHLVLFQHLFGLADPESNLLFDILLHFGTLVAVFIAFWKDVKELFMEFLLLLRDLFTGRFSPKRLAPYRRFLLMLALATLPLVLVVFLKDAVAGLYQSVTWVGIFLMVTGVLLYGADRLKPGRTGMGDTRPRQALLVGLMQTLAVAPGLSRSGSTVCAGLFAGFTREYALRFSFLMSIPAILGANILEVGDAVKDGFPPELILPSLLGAITAAVSGFFAIRLLQYLMKKNRFGVFAYYCFFVGILAVISGLIL